MILRRRFAYAAMVAVAVALVGAASASATTTTTTFSVTGAYSFTVPAGVTSITIHAVGGAGGSGENDCVGGAGGQGAGLTATVPVAAGASLRVLVAGNG